MTTAQREALARLRRYVEVRQTAKPISGLDDTVHRVHLGTEYEAEVRLSDIAAVVQPFAGGGHVHATCGGAVHGVSRSISARPDDATWPRDFVVTVPYCNTCRCVVSFELVRADNGGGM